MSESSSASSTLHIASADPDPLEKAVLYLLRVHRGALESQAATFEAQATEIRWGANQVQLPLGVSRDTAAEQLTTAAEKVRQEAEKVMEIESDVVYTLDTEFDPSEGDS